MDNKKRGLSLKHFLGHRLYLGDVRLQAVLIQRQLSWIRLRPEFFWWCNFHVRVHSGIGSAFGNWKVRRKCSANMFVGNFHVRRGYPSLFFHFRPICDICPYPTVLFYTPLRYSSPPLNILLMTYRPNVNGFCHCPHCHNALRVLGPTIGGIHGPGRYYLRVCAYIQLFSF